MFSGLPAAGANVAQRLEVAPISAINQLVVLAVVPLIPAAFMSFLEKSRVCGASETCKIGRS
jgi:hypothetical protein